MGAGVKLELALRRVYKRVSFDITGRGFEFLERGRRIMRLDRRVIRMGLCGVVLLAMAVPAMAAFHAIMTIKGEKQGEFKGESSTKGRSDIDLVSVLHERVGPAMVGDKRRHNPIVVTKEVGAASPQIFQAFTAKENLPVVELNIGSQPGGAGAGKIAQRVVLKNATITNVRKVGKLEEITFNYEAITVTWSDGSITSNDDWEAQI